MAIVLCLTLIGSVALVAITSLTASAATPVAGGSGYINENGVNLRSGAGTTYSIVTSMTKNTQISFISSDLYNNDWYHIKLSGGTEGYVHRDYVEASEPAPVIKLCRNSATTYVGCQYGLWQTGASNPTWSSSNTTIGTVDANGVFSAKAAGSVTITVSENGGSASCVIKVLKANPTGISASSIKIEQGKTATLTAKQSVNWFSSNTNVCTVSSSGVVTAKSIGYATISAYTSSGASTCLVQVVEASKIKMCRNSATTYVGCQYGLWQTGADNPTWSSSNNSVATVDANGVVTAKGVGSATITASEGGSSASCVVKVLAANPTGISNSSVKIEQGNTFSLSAKQNVNWFSSNTNVCTVSSSGVVTAKELGYATISAYTSNGASTCLVQVVEQQKIKLCRNSATTYVGCQYALWQTGASNPTWKSSNTTVGTVDSNGVFTAKAAGSVTITVSEGGSSASCVIKVLAANPTGISNSSLKIEVGKTATLTSNKTVNWFSSNTNVCTVSASGVVTAKATGYATISAYTSNGASTCLVQVVAESKIKMCRSTATTYAGCQYALWQTGASNPTWSSSNTSVATVDSNGVVTAKSAGSVTITASEGGYSASCVIKVLAANPTGISSSSIKVEIGKTAPLTATKSVNWFSSNTNVCTVNSNGVVSAKALGYATISAYTSNGASTCLVQVTEATVEIAPVKGYINESYVNMRAGASTSFSIITTLTEDTELIILSETLYGDGWYFVETESGLQGYVKGEFVTVPAAPNINLCRSTATTYVGCQYALWQTGADDPLWTSTNPSVASVDTNGIVTAKSAGKATITVSQQGVAESCVFTVKSDTATNISKTSATVEAGKTITLTSNTSGVGWFSSNTNVCTVSSSGVVTGKSEGYATISAYTSSGAATCLVMVTKSTAPVVGKIVLSTSSARVYSGSKYAIGMTGSTSATWTSSNTSVATVDSNGVVTAKSSGTATITASNSVSSATCTISVASGYDTGISLSSVDVPCGKSIVLQADDYVSWTTSNNSIAAVTTVDGMGIVDTKAEGYVTIHANTSYGSSSCLIHVTAPDNIRFVYASPNSAPLNSKVTFKAITDQLRTAVRFTATNGSNSVTVDATSKVKDGNYYIWTATATLGYSGNWTVKAYSKTASTNYATTPENGEGEVFVTNSTNTTTTVLGERRASDEVIELIALFEGFLPDVTADYITDDPTVGHGKVVTRNEQFYNHLTRNEAYAYLCQTVNYGPYTTKTNQFLTSNSIRFNQQQFDALVCFAYNVGAYALINDSQLSSLLLNTGSAGSGTIKAGGAGYVNTDYVNLRSGAGTGYSVVTTMDEGTTFTFVDATLYNSNWYKIKLSNGTTGYIYSDYASATASGGTRDLNNINKSAFTTRMLQYHHAAGECYWGLLTRRVDEVEMFFYGDYECDGEFNKYGMYFRCANNSSFGIG